jgi:hypothetical protein
MTIQLIHADCLTVNWPQVDAIITDIPYGTTACKWDVIIPFDAMWAKIKGSLKQRGAFVTTASQPFTSALVMSNPNAYNCCWFWAKDKAANFGVAKYRPLNIFEEIITFSYDVPKYNPQMWDNGFKKNKGGKGAVINGVYGKNGFKWSYKETTEKYPTNFLYFATPKHNDKDNGSLHPTQKPVALYEYLIKTYTNEGDTVLDFCMGSGTTGVACLNTGRNFIGIEKDDKYYNIAKDRINGSHRPK